MSPVIRHSGRGKEMTGYSNGSPRAGIVGAAIVPHAPQFLTLPETEDKAQVARVNTAMREIGDKFRALDPDLVIVISNAHCDDFVVRCVPAFALHIAAPAPRAPVGIAAGGRSTAAPVTRWSRSCSAR